jgi:hypothetical protein
MSNQSSSGRNHKVAPINLIEDLIDAVGPMTHIHVHTEQTAPVVSSTLQALRQELECQYWADIAAELDYEDRGSHTWLNADVTADEDDFSPFGWNDDDMVDYSGDEDIDDDYYAYDDYEMYHGVQDDRRPGPSLQLGLS